MIALSKKALVALAMLLMSVPILFAAEAYDPASSGTRMLESRGGTTIKMLVEESTLGGSELEMGVITLPAGSESSGHSHGSTELFYILNGELDHIVNGEPYHLTPGMVGIVRAGDEVIHRVPGTQPVEALIIWTPGGEAERLSNGGFTSRPVE